MSAGGARRAVDLGGVAAYVYEPAERPLGAYVVAQGLHYEGPDDPRFDRFARALCAARFRVYAPKLSAFLALQVTDGARVELERALEAACDAIARDGLPPPALFSVSFGSLPAIAAAASPRLASRLGGLVLFGGYCDFESAITFALTGRTPDGRTRPYDSSNAPVVHMHLADASLDAFDVPRVVEAWRRVVHATWGRPELRDARARAPHAEAIARELPPPEREAFLRGCGLGADPAPHVARLRALASRYTFADPRPHLARLQAPVLLVHGRDDDVIPFEETEKLARALPPSHPRRVILTGLYGHTGSALPRPGDVAREAAAMATLVRALVLAPLGGERFAALCAADQ